MLECGQTGRWPLEPVSLRHLPVQTMFDSFHHLNMVNWLAHGSSCGGSRQEISHLVDTRSVKHEATIKLVHSLSQPTMSSGKLAFVEWHCHGMRRTLCVQMAFGAHRLGFLLCDLSCWEQGIQQVHLVSSQQSIGLAGQTCKYDQTGAPMISNPRDQE